MLFKACWGQRVLDQTLNATGFSHTPATSKKKKKRLKRFEKERVIKGVFYCFTTFQKNSWWMKQMRLWESSWFQTDCFISLLQTTCRLLALVSALPRTNWDQQAEDHVKSRDYAGISCSLTPSSPALFCVPCWNIRFLLLVFKWKDLCVWLKLNRNWRTRCCLWLIPICPINLWQACEEFSKLTVHTMSKSNLNCMVQLQLSITQHFL